MKERVDRIFIDYLRNGEGATTVAAYSVRARKGAPVSTPLHWDEVGGRLKPTSFHAGNVVRRLQGLHSDPWKTFRRTSQTLTATMKRKLGIVRRTWRVSGKSTVGGWKCCSGTMGWGNRPNLEPRSGDRV